MPEHITFLPDRYAISRLDPDEPIPAWSKEGPISSVTRTSSELTIVSLQQNVPLGVSSEPGWVAAEVEGPLPFTATGILSSILHPLSSRGISVFAISTFTTDLILLKQENVEAAALALKSAGHRVSDQSL